MAALFKDLIKPMYSLGKNTFTIKFEKDTKDLDFKKAVIDYLNSIGINCCATGERLGAFSLLNIEGKPYTLEKRYITNESAYLSEVAVLVEK